ncbi:MAG: hypothetical protein QNJ07_10925 [Woeseiaceae bacterium]|nr:hypothetical protein [Woeseiaceae bacterium]
MQIFFLLAAALHLAMLVVSFRLKAGVPEWLWRLLICGFIYDNVIVGLGPAAIGGSWYEFASGMRYLTHVIVLPPLVVAALFIARRTGAEWAHGRTAFLMAGVFVVAAIDVGIVTEIAGLQLVPETLYGHERLVSAQASLPLATIATHVVILGIGVAIWRRTGWTTLFAAALAILLVNGATATQPWGVLVSNLVEVGYAYGWLLTLRRFPR